MPLFLFFGTKPPSVRPSGFHRSVDSVTSLCLWPELTGTSIDLGQDTQASAHGPTPSEKRADERTAVRPRDPEHGWVLTVTEHEGTRATRGRTRPAPQSDPFSGTPGGGPARRNLPLFGVRPPLAAFRVESKMLLLFGQNGRVEMMSRKLRPKGSEFGPNPFARVLTLTTRVTWTGATCSSLRVNEHLGTKICPCPV